MLSTKRVVECDPLDAVQLHAVHGDASRSATRGMLSILLSSLLSLVGGSDVTSWTCA